MKSHLESFKLIVFTSCTGSIERKLWMVVYFLCGSWWKGWCLV